MFQTSLKSIQQILETDGFKCKHLAKTRQIPFEQLYIWLDIEGLPDKVILQLRLLEHPVEDTQHREKGELHLLQFFAGLPFNVNQDKVIDTLRFLSLINKSFELPGFEFSEVDLLVYYRYVLITSENAIPSLLIRNLIGVIMFILDSFSTKIHEIAIGKRSLKDVVEEAIKENED